MFLRYAIIAGNLFIDVKCVLLTLYCDTIFRKAFSLKKIAFSLFFNKGNDSVKTKQHLTKELLWNKTLPNFDILVSKFTVTVQS